MQHSQQSAVCVRRGGGISKRASIFACALLVESDGMGWDGMGWDEACSDVYHINSGLMLVTELAQMTGNETRYTQKICGCEEAAVGSDTSEQQRW
jgi:hypothetical protein